MRERLLIKKPLVRYTTTTRKVVRGWRITWLTWSVRCGAAIVLSVSEPGRYSHYLLQAAASTSLNLISSNRVSYVRHCLCERLYPPVCYRIKHNMETSRCVWSLSKSLACNQYSFYSDLTSHFELLCIRSRKLIKKDNYVCCANFIHE